MSYPRFIISVLVAGLTTHFWDTFENTWNFFCRWCFALLSFPLQNCLRTVKFTLDVFMTHFCLHSWYWCMWSLFIMHLFLYLSVSVPFSDKLEHRKFSDCTYMAIQTFPSWGKLVWWWLLSICVTRASMNWGCACTCVCMCLYVRFVSTSLCHLVSHTDSFWFLKKLDVGRQSRILNTTQNWVVSRAFCSIAHHTCHFRSILCPL